LSTPRAVDPYKNFKFRVLWDGKTVLGVSKVGSLKRTTEVVKHRSGGQNSYDHKSPGRSSYEGVTLERGITHDIEFEKWANAVQSYAGDAAMDLAGYKKDLTLEVLNEKSQVALRYFLYRCWVSEFVTRARPRCERQRGCHRAHQDRTRRLGA
jgi:phage tail-like protein